MPTFREPLDLEDLESIENTVNSILDEPLIAQKLRSNQSRKDAHDALTALFLIKFNEDNLLFFTFTLTGLKEDIIKIITKWIISNPNTELDFNDKKLQDKVRSFCSHGEVVKDKNGQWMVTQFIESNFNFEHIILTLNHDRFFRENLNKIFNPENLAKLNDYIYTDHFLRQSRKDKNRIKLTIYALEMANEHFQTLIKYLKPESQNIYPDRLNEKDFIDGAYSSYENFCLSSEAFKPFLLHLPNYLKPTSRDIDVDKLQQKDFLDGKYQSYEDFRDQLNKKQPIFTKMISGYKKPSIKETLETYTQTHPKWREFISKQTNPILKPKK